MSTEEELRQAFEKWTKSQEEKDKDWEGKLERTTQLQEKGLGQRVVGFHCPWCRYKTLYYRLSETGMHCLTCKMDWSIECLSPELLEQAKTDKKLERTLLKEEKDE